MMGAPIRARSWIPAFAGMTMKGFDDGKA